MDVEVPEKADMERLPDKFVSKQELNGTIMNLQALEVYA